MSEENKNIDGVEGTPQMSQAEQVAGLLHKLDNKDFSLFFFVLDTLGNPVAGVANIYEHVKVLNDLGYNAVIMHEKNDYKLRIDPTNEEDNGRMGIGDWLGEEYANLPHISIENQQLNITPADFIIIPEIFANIMDQVKKFPCKKIVFSQSYDYLLELLPIGKKWNYDYGFHDVITTSEKQARYVSSLFQGISTHIVPVSIPDYFKPDALPKIPVVTIVSRNQSDAKKIANAFYLQYPMYKFITFKELRGMAKVDFAKELGKSCLSVWIDDASGFGTFPLEAMKCGTPVIGKIPNLVPEWMEVEATNEDGTPMFDDNGNKIMVVKNNGIWTNTTTNIAELIATYMKVWFEDSVPQHIITEMGKAYGDYSVENQRVAIETVYGNLVNKRKEELTSLVAKEQPIETNEENKA
jgi:hypothetical protein